MDVLIPEIAAFAIADVDRATAIPVAPMINLTFAIPAQFPQNTTRRHQRRKQCNIPARLPMSFGLGNQDG